MKQQCLPRNKEVPLLCLRLSLSASFIIGHIISFMSFHVIKCKFCYYLFHVISCPIKSLSVISCPIKSLSEISCQIMCHETFLTIIQLSRVRVRGRQGKICLPRPISCHFMSFHVIHVILFFRPAFNKVGRGGVRGSNMSFYAFGNSFAVRPKAKMTT
jgi:hypothetical protein